MKRIEILKQVTFKKSKINGILVLSSNNLTWLTGFSGASALLAPKNGESVVYVYGVNYAQAEAELTGIKVELVKRGENLLNKIAKHASAFEINRLAVDALSAKGWRMLTKFLGGENALEVDDNFLWNLRRVKDGNEIELVRKASQLTSEGMRVAGEVMAAGMKEYEVAAEIEYKMRKLGSSGTAFETIVASGVCSAFPHGRCSDKEIQKKDLVVVDLGATYKLYRSDMTRTFVIGKPTEKQKKLHQIVKTAQNAAFETVKSNVKAKDVDAAARKIIAKAGYKKYFVHSLGHGIGLEVHEPPTLSPNSEDLLVVGNVVTIEPGIYISGYGGVRIEDTVLVQEDGAQRLTDGIYTLGK